MAGDPVSFFPSVCLEPRALKDPRASAFTAPGVCARGPAVNMVQGYQQQREWGVISLPSQTHRQTLPEVTGGNVAGGLP